MMESTVVAATREIKTATAEQVAEFDRHAKTMQEMCSADVGVTYVNADRIPAFVAASLNMGGSFDAVMLAAKAAAATGGSLSHAAPSNHSSGYVSLMITRPPTAEELADEGLWR